MGAGHCRKSDRSRSPSRPSVTELVWEAEAGEEAWGHKCRHFGDTVAPEREHVHHRRGEVPLLRQPCVAADSPLAVGAERTMPPTGLKRMFGEERDDRLATVVPRSHRRHGPGGIFGQELHEAVDIRTLEWADGRGDEGPGG